MRGPWAHLIGLESVQGLFLSLSPQCWDYRCVLQHPAFYVGGGDHTHVLMLAWQALYPLRHLLSPQLLLFGRSELEHA